MLQHDAMDTLAFMLEAESTTYACTDYLNNSNVVYNTPSQSSNAKKTTSADRMRIVDWCYKIVDACKFQRETVAIAINILDRFVSCISTSHLSSSSGPSRDVLYNRGQYQLAALTSLYISIKINERVVFGSEEFASTSHGIYLVDEIEDMERRILEVISWRVCPPTSLQFGCHVISLLQSQTTLKTIEQDTWNYIKDEMAYQVENSIRYYHFVTYRPSTVALAALLNAIEKVNDCGYNLLTFGLARVLNELYFDPLDVLMETRDCLNIVLNENEASDCSDDVSILTVYPTDTSVNADAVRDTVHPTKSMTDVRDW